MKSLIRLSNNRNLKINNFLNNDHHDLEESIENFLMQTDLLNINTIKTKQNGNVKYSILRENNTNTWFFVTKNIFILHLPISKYRHFYDLYKDSEQYKFVVYVRRRENVIVNSDSEMIVFCVSHLLNDDNYDDFMEINKKWSIRSAYILSKRLGNFIPINRPYSDLINKERSQLLGIHILGNGRNDHCDLNSTMNFVLMWVNNNKNHLPYHNLILNR